MMRAILYIFVALLWGCSSEKHAGNASETTNHIAGTLQFADGKPAASARVTLYQLHGSPDTVTEISTKLSNKKGSFLFDDLKPGRYALEAIHEESKTQWVQSQVESAPDSVEQVISGTLDQTAKLQVSSLAIPDSLGFEWTLVCNAVYSLPITRDADTLLSLPAGITVVQIQVSNPAKGAAAIWASDTLNLVSQDTVDLGNMSPWTPQTWSASPFLLDDFDDGNLWSPLETSWWVFSDQNNGGNSSIAFADADSIGVDSPGLGEEGYAARFQYEFGTNAPTFVGFGISPVPYTENRLINLTELDSLTFALKGNGVARVQLCALSSLGIGGDPSCVFVTDSIPAEWTEFRIAWGQVTDSSAVMNRMLAKDLTLMLTPLEGAGTSGELWVDEFGWSY